MKKWAVIETKKSGDEFVRPFRSREEAGKEADRDWYIMTKSDKESCSSYIVGLVNLDETGNFLELENGDLDSDIYEIAKKYK